MSDEPGVGEVTEKLGPDRGQDLYSIGLKNEGQENWFVAPCLFDNKDDAEQELKRLKREYNPDEARISRRPFFKEALQ